MCSYHNISAQSRTEKSALEPPPINSIRSFQGLIKLKNRAYFKYCTVIGRQPYQIQISLLAHSAKIN